MHCYGKGRRAPRTSNIRQPFYTFPPNHPYLVTSPTLLSIQLSMPSLYSPVGSNNKTSKPITLSALLTTQYVVLTKSPSLSFTKSEPGLNSIYFLLVQHLRPTSVLSALFRSLHLIVFENDEDQRSILQCCSQVNHKLTHDTMFAAFQ